MRRQTATVTALAVLALAALTGCQSTAECRREYIAQQKKLTGLTPTAQQARDACDRSHGASRYRGGGSGVGK